ncbi:hypothetical protein B0I37DRAFT_63403 [Chaetomium sp. MPI-CAGE-AT-0009]|nr:hypothetical protein B0I37DRAFT_63403 [Chaetomium sp. MPI-CAGE-AT-0009]
MVIVGEDTLVPFFFFFCPSLSGLFSFASSPLPPHPGAIRAQSSILVLKVTFSFLPFSFSTFFFFFYHHLTASGYGVVIYRL